MLRFDEHPSPTLRCAGDEDRTTQSRRRRALSRALKARGDIVVDLRELGFADPSLMLDLAMLARRKRLRGRCMHLHSPQPQILTLIELVGLDRLAGVTVQRPAVA